MLDGVGERPRLLINLTQHRVLKNFAGLHHGESILWLIYTTLNDTDRIDERGLRFSLEVALAPDCFPHDSVV